MREKGERRYHFEIRVYIYLYIYIERARGKRCDKKDTIRRRMCEIRIEDDGWVGQLDWKQVAMGSSGEWFVLTTIKVIRLRWKMVTFIREVSLKIRGELSKGKKERKTVHLILSFWIILKFWRKNLTCWTHKIRTCINSMSSNYSSLYYFLKFKYFSWLKWKYPSIVFAIDRHSKAIS